MIHALEAPVLSTNSRGGVGERSKLDPNSNRARHLRNPAAILFVPFTTDVVYGQGRTMLSFVVK